MQTLDFLQNLALLSNDHNAFNIEAVVPVEEVEGTKQDCELFNHVFVKQWSGGSPAGDDYAGYLFIPITSFYYLKIYYA